jgi:hypothetical protein
MGNFRAPLITSTTAIVSPDAAVNAEKCIAIEKSGINDDEILFVFDYNQVDSNVVWKYATTGDRDTEYALLDIDSAQFKAGVDAAFVSSTAALVSDRTGAVVVNNPSINLNKVTSIDKVDIQSFLGVGGQLLYKLVFIYDGVNELRELSWNYAVLADRDTTYTELTALAAALQYIP